MRATTGLRTGGTGPHAGQALAKWGAPVADAEAALILLHGRGSHGSEILGLAPLLATSRFAVLAPDALSGTWYPNRFTAPVRQNEPFLSSAISVVEDQIAGLQALGLPGEQIALAGFSQGACLALECAARHAGRLGAVVAFSGGLIGDFLDPEFYQKHDGMPVFLGCSDHDPHIPLRRLRETEAAFRNLGAEVELRLYAGGSHDINPDELDAARHCVAGVGTGSVRSR